MDSQISHNTQYLIHHYFDTHMCVSSRISCQNLVSKNVHSKNEEGTKKKHEKKNARMQMIQMAAV